MSKLSIFLGLLCICSSYYITFPGSEYYPEQVHVSYYESGTLSFTWVTQNDTDESKVLYRQGYSTFSVAIGYSKPFNPGNRTFYNHHVVIKNMFPNTTYEYYVGTDKHWSDKLYIRVPHNIPDKKFSFVVYADYGYTNDVSTSAIENIVLDGRVDMVMHAGDMAYDLNTYNGTMGDSFMRMIQPFSSRVPYQVCPGNHEYIDNFTHYKSRFTLPGDSDGLWYSYNVPNAHIISISTEVYFSDTYDGMINQYNWLELDLAQAVKNRVEYPWIIMYGHRPMYCSEITTVDYGRKQELDRMEKYNGPYQGCTISTSLVRDGITIRKKQKYGLESLLKKYNVDVFICGHEHIYERMFPVYQNMVEKQDLHTYINPQYPTHIISGSPGCDEKLDVFNTTAGPWSAFRSATYGIGILDIYNSSYLHWQQIDTTESETNTTLIDEFVIIKE